ncbi:hypothetical protein C5E11_00645 [Clavibacter michiganensis]|nr:hypothetical protein [Clavibacter michiganensis]PPF65430.1 hypothetical protein C5E11_00645 [Clavibacter michiganensis]
MEFESTYQLTVAVSMFSVLNSPTAIRSVDERLFEGLLVECLNELPALEEALELPPSRRSTSLYSLGGRGFPDIVRRPGDEYEVGIEVKLRSNHNLQGGYTENPRWQLDAYADRRQSGTKLFIVAPSSKRASLEREFEGYGKGRNPLLESIKEWRFIHTETVRDSLESLLGDRCSDEVDGAKLVTRLARLKI